MVKSVRGVMVKGKKSRSFNVFFFALNLDLFLILGNSPTLLLFTRSFNRIGFDDL